MKRTKVVLQGVALALLIIFNGCSDSTDEVVLDGISVGGSATSIKVKEITVSDKTATSASLASGVASLDADFAITDAGIVISSESTLPDEDDTMISFGAVAAVTDFSLEASDLSPSTVYYVRVYVATASGYGFGNVVAFETSDWPADVILINEGNYSSGDGSFSTYNTLTGEVSLSVFAAANGYPIAATIQNAAIFNDQIFAVTNSSDKLEVMDASTFESVAYISSGLSNPFDFAAIGDKGYVTNWGTLNYSTYQYEDPYIAVIDLTDYSISGTIELDVQPQHVLAVGDYFYVANVGGSSISVFDPSSDSEIATIDVSYGPDKMVVDANEDIWVICTSGNLVQIDASTNAVVQTISGISGSGYNEKMVIDAEGDDLYYLSSSGWPDYETAIYSLHISATTAPEEALVSGQNYYGLGVSPAGQLFIADANAFQGNGTVSVYDLDGTLTGSFAAGRGPNGFIFR